MEPAQNPGERSIGASDPMADLRELSQFLGEYCSVQLGAGGQTQRVNRTASRIAQAYGCSVELAVFPMHIMMNVSDAANESLWTASVGTVRPGVTNFRLLASLNELSWKAHDGSLTFTELREEFHAVLAHGCFSPAVALFSVACANAAFCRLFGGDSGAMGLVFFATLFGFRMRQMLAPWGRPHLTVIWCACASSLLVAFGGVSGISRTPEVALATSVLFLIPGVPLINAVLDVLSGHTLMAFSRFVRATLLIVCIGLGLAATLTFTGFGAGASSALITGHGIWFDVLLDGVVAAAAAAGFAVISNPSRHVAAYAAALAALGHGMRYYLFQTGTLGMTASSFAAALLIGAASVMLAKRTRTAAEFYSILALLPMVPGMYAYGTVLAIIHFMGATDAPAEEMYLAAIFKNGLTALFVVCALSIGATAPLFLQSGRARRPFRDGHAKSARENGGGMKQERR